MVTKKIVILTPVLPPYHGGMGKAALAEAEYLVREHDVTIFTPKYSYIDKDEDERGKVKIKYIKPFFVSGNAAVLSNLKKELQGFDIIYLHYPFFGTAELFNYKLKAKSYKLVIRYHMDVVGRSWLKPFFWLHTRFLMPRILQRADKIIVSTLDYAQNSNIKNLIKKYPEKFIEITFGVDTEKFKPELKNKELLLKHGLQESDKILLFVGSLDQAHYFKGLDILLKSLSYNLQPTTYNLVIVGDGDLRPHYEALVKKLSLSKIVKFVGSVSNDDLPKYYNIADVFVFPSIDRSEAFGLALLEAASCGKSLVASNLPGVRTLVQDGKNGFLSRSSVADLSGKITKALENNESFGRESRRLVEDNYAQEKIASRLLDFFDKFC